MISDFVGVIIEESLKKKDVLNRIKILKTKISPVTEKHRTPWLTQWTLFTVEIPRKEADRLAKEISLALELEHPWYADYKNDSHHYIIFRDKVFFIDRKSQEQYDEAKDYGLALGIPDYQLDFKAN